jgi:manganese/zinc/iron transport system ATP- binding protein
MIKDFKNVLSISNLTCGYDEKIILENIKLDIPENVKCAIVGPNGAGKTTLMKCLVNLHDKKNGKILFWNKDFNSIREKIAYVPQRKLVDWSFPITVHEVVKMGAYDISKSWFSKIPYEAEVKTIDALNKMNLYNYSNAHINDLSGGQQQRVFIARALAQNADLYLMDEPLTGLDRTSEKIISQIFNDIKELGKTVIAVHHDWNTVKEYFDWIVLINKNVIYSGSLSLSENELKNLLEKTFE